MKAMMVNRVIVIRTGKMRKKSKQIKIYVIDIG